MFIRILGFLLISLSLFGSTPVPNLPRSDRFVEVAIRGSNTSEFYASFDQKKSEQWLFLVETGEKALQEYSDPKIHARLASIYFYLGNYEMMKQHIDACITESLDDESEELLIRSLYLLSAYHRINKNYFSAQQVIQKALVKARAYNKPWLLAKVLFNAGAAEADLPKGDIELAQKYYEEALSCVPPNSDDAHRLLIRLGRIYLLKNAFYKLNPLLTSLSRATLAPRTQVHFYYLYEQTTLAKDAAEEAQQWIEKGLQLAKKLHMRKGYERLESLKR